MRDSHTHVRASRPTIRRARRAGFAAALCALAVLGLWGATPRPDEPSLVRPYSNELPVGEGRAIAEGACLMCHTATLITQQKKDSTAWAKTVATMVQWGAPVEPREKDPLVRYLVARFGPTTPRPAPPGPGASKPGTPPKSIVVVPPPNENTPTPGDRPKFGEYVYVEELPEAIFKAPANYPDQAKRAGIEGTVMIQALVIEDGTIAECRVVKSVPELDEAAIVAVKQWRFRPALAKGKPVAVWVAVPVRFTP